MHLLVGLRWINTFSTKHLQLKGLSKDGSQRFRYHCKLHTVEKCANDFTKELTPYVNSPHQFCTKLCTVTDGTVVNDSIPPSSQDHTNPTSSIEHTNPTSSQERTNPTTSQERTNPTTSQGGTNPTSSQEGTNPTSSRQHRKRVNSKEADMTASKRRKAEPTQGEHSGDQIQEEIAEQQIGKFIHCIYHITIELARWMGAK